MILIYLCFLQVSSFTINVLYSFRSPFELVHIINSTLSQNFELNSKIVDDTHDIDNLIKLPGIVIDITFSLSIHEKIVQTAMELNFIILNTDAGHNNLYSN